MSITLQIIICILIADFLTGFGHWLEDTYCLNDTPLIGKGICKPNIDHHQYPTLMLKTATFINTNLISMSIMLVIYFVLFLFGYGFWNVLLTCILTGFGNQVHSWNHQSKVNYWVQWLKDSGLIQTQKMHSLHHIPPYDKCYCSLINFNNAWLDRVNFWRKLEWVLDKFGLKVKRGLPERNGH